ncbi:hypothetical protein XENOCAPTIV_011421 [Xenoophorus captivus]|uniref:Uncharacterized protein n=1 Tax=Xenoophorus captivus TaxID=1517983 RepID=A0ABV0QN22_9TELE
MRTPTLGGEDRCYGLPFTVLPETTPLCWYGKHSGNGPSSRGSERGNKYAIGKRSYPCGSRVGHEQRLEQPLFCCSEKRGRAPSNPGLESSEQIPQKIQREIEGHQPRVDEVLERGRRMAAAASEEDRPEAERIRDQMQELEQAWARLQNEMAKRRERLSGSNLTQQYYNDADEAEAWIGEQELYMIADEKAKKLSDRAQKMFAEDHPDGFVEEIIRRQGQVDKQYAGLKELAEDRRKKLKHTYHHFLLCREVEDLEHWIAERDVVASSQEMGQDLDHVTERVDMVNQTIDELIETGHSEAATLAEWKDSINESWADLLELIDTRSQLLTASYDLLKYVSYHVQQFQETAMRLRAQYAGDKQEAIQAMEREVVEAWKGLLDASDGRRTQLVDTAEKFRFFSMVRDLMAWMESIIQQIETQEKPRCAPFK